MSEAPPPIETTADPPVEGNSRRVFFFVALTVVAVVAAVLYIKRNDTDNEYEPVPPPEFDYAQLPDDVAREMRAARKRVTDNPMSANAWGKLGQLCLAHQFLKESIVCFCEAERLDATDYRWPYLAGVAHATGDRVAAIDAYRRAIKTAKTQPLPKLRLAELLLEREEYGEAHSLFLTVEQSQPNDRAMAARALLGRARIDFARNQTSRARQLAERSAQLAPGQRATHELLAGIYHRLKETVLAKRQESLLHELPPGETVWPDPPVQAVIELRKDDRWQAALAEQFLRRGESAKGEQIFRKVIERNPQRPDYSSRFALLLMQHQNITGAARVLDDSIRLNPTAASLHSLRAEIERLQGRHREAAVLFRKTVQLKSDHATGWQGLGMCEMALNHPDAAITAFRRAVQIDASLWRSHARLSVLLRRKGETTEADRHAAAARAIRPNDSALEAMLKGDRG